MLRRIQWSPGIEENSGAIGCFQFNAIAADFARGAMYRQRDWHLWQIFKLEWLGYRTFTDNPNQPKTYCWRNLIPCVAQCFKNASPVQQWMKFMANEARLDSLACQNIRRLNSTLVGRTLIFKRRTSR